MRSPLTQRFGKKRPLFSSNPLLAASGVSQSAVRSRAPLQERRTHVRVHETVAHYRSPGAGGEAAGGGLSRAFLSGGFGGWRMKLEQIRAS